MSEQVKAPWTAEQVRNLEEFQNSPLVHPFTHSEAPLNEDGQHALIPTEKGWVTRKGGPVVQDWAWDFMLDGTVMKAFEAVHRELEGLSSYMEEV